MPAFAEDVLNAGAEGLGFLSAAVGCGALLGALIGWFTNWLAIRMLFRPLRPVRILGFLFLGEPPPVLGTECTRIVGCPENARCK